MRRVSALVRPGAGLLAALAGSVLLGCSGGPKAPRAGTSAPAISASAAGAALVDTSIPLRRFSRWGFSFRWPLADALYAVGPSDTRCGGLESPDSAYEESGRRIWLGGSAHQPDLRLWFGPLPPDSLLLQLGLARSDSSPSGWVIEGIGRAAHGHGAAVMRGSRWLMLWGGMGGGALASQGGTAADSRPVGYAIVTRADGCHAVLEWGDSVLARLQPVDFWRLLESVRFAGEDEVHELPGPLQALPSRGSDWRRRLGLVYRGPAGEGCFVTANDAVPEGAPVHVVDPTGGTPAFWAHMLPGPGCAAPPGSSADTLHSYQLQPYPDETLFPSGLGLLGDVPLHVAGDTVSADLDGDGRFDTFGACYFGDKLWGWARSGGSAGKPIWRLGVPLKRPYDIAGDCPAGVVW